MTPVFTHKGWFLLCPIYIAGLNTEAPFLDPRHWSLMPWFLLNEALLALFFFVSSLVDKDFEPVFPIRVTGELPCPRG